jgi:two-component system cell cycle sensor histidine kinase/response regulator CckA
MSTISATSPASIVLRRLLPLAIVVTIATAWLRWLATSHGLVSEPLGIAIMTALAVALFSGLAIWSVRVLRSAAATDRDALYRRVAANLPDVGLFLFDRDLRYVLASGGNFSTVGLRPDDLEGRTIWEALEPEAAAAIEPSSRAALAGERTTFEMDFRGQTYRVTVAPAYENGEIAGGLVFSQEISERRKLEEQLLQSQKLEAIGLLAGGVAHDFNNLLTVISGYASLSLRALPENDEVRLGLEHISTAATRAAALTQQLLAFSRRQLLLPRPIDVNRAVESTLPMLRALVEESVELELRLADALPPALFDLSRLEQVIVNLVVNARDAIADVGTISIETTEAVLDDDWAAVHAAPAGRYIVLAVSDTGAGMDEITRSRIFEPFFTTKAAGRGTGLGLSTVHGIVTQSGGAIWVYSERGRGTTFKVYLPVAEATVPVPDAPPRRGRRGGGATVLVVEDDAAVRVLTARMLDRAGYRVLEATSVDDATGVLGGSDVDVILTDLVMPGGSGRLLAELVDAPPLVYMSGYTEAAVSAGELAVEAARFVEKPFTSETLVDAVEDALAGATLS